MAPEMLTEQPVEEHRILGHVTARLAEEFPDTHPAVVREIAARAFAGLADARIREFVEIFVHREARALLHTYSAEPATPAPTAADNVPRQRRRDLVARSAG